MFLRVLEGRDCVLLITTPSLPTTTPGTQNILNKNLIKEWIYKWQLRLFYPLADYLPEDARLPTCLLPLSTSCTGFPTALLDRTALTPYYLP